MRNEVKRLNNELFLDISQKKKGTFISCLSVWTKNVTMDWKDRIDMTSTWLSQWKVLFL